MSALKLKKIEGKELDNYFTNCKIPEIITDGRLMALNNIYLIMAWNDNPGSINMVNAIELSNMDIKTNTFYIENSNILDMEFSPFDSNIFCFSNENKKIYFAQITKENKILSDVYKNHKNKVNFIGSNPVASNVICSCTLSGEIHIWDSVKFKTQIDFKVSYNVNDVHWNTNGSLIGISKTNRLLTIIDPRKSTKNFEAQITDLNSKTKFGWLNDYSLSTIGYKKLDKQYYLNLYDIRQTIKNPFSSIKINFDPNSSSLTPFVDPELKLIYITAKDDYYIKIYDYNSGSIQNYGEYKTSEINNFSIQLDRKYLNKTSQEIDRFSRYMKNNKLFYLNNFYLFVN